MSCARSIACAAVLGLLANPSVAVGAGAAFQGTVAPAAAPSREVLDRYCVTCHNQRLKTGGLALDRLDPAAVATNPAIWEKVVRKLRGGLMPPAGRPRPEPAAVDAFASALEANLDRTAAVAPNAGYVEPYHRLNRTEYQNAVRDLLALEIDASELLPADDASYGFDNIAGTLKVSQARMERYLSAARTISRLAVGHPVSTPSVDVFKVSPDLSLPQYDRVEGLPFGTRGGVRIPYTFPEDAEYELRVELVCASQGSGDLDCDGSAGFPDRHELEVTVDGARVSLFVLEPKPARELGSGKVEPLRIRIPVKAGPHEVAAAFLRNPAIEAVQEGYRLPFTKPQVYHEQSMKIFQPFVDKVTLSGPFQSSGPGTTPSRQAIFTCRPSSQAEEIGCAKTILSNLARRAFRRPTSDADVRMLLRFYEEGSADGAGFESGIEYGVRALLMSPEFWFRTERTPTGAKAKANYPITDVELASRLSFFIWSSIPDEELLNLAGRGTLRQPHVLDQQVRRMLADPRSRALTTNFAAQWLQLRNLRAVRPNNDRFPDFDQSLRQALQTETELFFDSIVRDDRSIVELLTAKYTFVNDRLARHYGIPNVNGSHFRRVSLTDDSPRRGLLGQGSLLTITSHATRTSPVKRGKWILDNILGSPPPPPPPNVPALPEQDKSATKRALTMRELMAAHRANPVCSACHSMIDPAGFALENFDAVGRFRTIDTEAFTQVDASGTLPDGTPFAGLTEFRDALARKPERFATTLTEKLMVYALGRGIEYYDVPAVRKVVREAAGRDFRFSAVVLGIVESLPFQARRASAETAGGVAAAAHQ